MKFLLTAINAKYIHSNPAIYSLRAYAGEKLRPHIPLAEYTVNQQMQDILADIYKRKPDAVGFSCYIWNWDMVQNLLRELPKVLPNTDIWLGGPQVSFDAPEVLTQFPQLKGIMVGEGEETFRELLRWYTAQELETVQETLAEIAGLCLPGEEKPFYTPVRELIDLDKVPFLYDDLEPFTNRILYYETSRGCPYCCSYCLSSIDRRVRFRNIDTVKRELRFFLDHRVKQVKFVDRTFNCNHEHAMAIWRYLKEHDNGVTNFHFEISADILKEDEISLLGGLRPGLVQLEIGVQSTNPKTLDAVRRAADTEKLERVVAQIYENGNIHQHLDLIAGLPYEDYESFSRSFNRVYAMRPQQLQLGFLKVLKGCAIQEKAKEYGIRYTDKPPYEVLCTDWLSYGEVLRLKKVEEMVELYYNSNQFTHTLAFLEHVFESPFAMYERLADFYEEKGYFAESPARAYRYQVLYDFAKSFDGEWEDIYRELLTYDLYLRENLKSRPEFLKDVTDVSLKEEIRDFYRGEEKERTYLTGYADHDWKQMSKMTHLEPFDYPVWDDALLAKYRSSRTDSKPVFVLFDYQRRNPLNYEAKTSVIGRER